MSWDLELVPPEAEHDVFAWLEGEPAEDRAAADAHGRAVLRVVPQLELVRRQLVSDDESVPLTVDLFGTHATMNVAYWGGTTTTAAPVVGRIAQALAAAGPFLVFDPQEGELIDPAEVEQRFRDQHPRGTAVVERFARRDRRPWYRQAGTVVALVVLAAVVLHRAGVV